MTCHFCRRPIDHIHESYWEYKATALLPGDRAACNNCASEMTARQAIEKYNGQREACNARLDHLAKKLLGELL